MSCDTKRPNWRLLRIWKYWDAIPAVTEAWVAAMTRKLTVIGFVTDEVVGYEA